MFQKSWTRKYQGSRGMLLTEYDMGFYWNSSEASHVSMEIGNLTIRQTTQMPTNVVRKVTVMGVFMFFAVLGNSAVLVTLFRARAWRRPISSFIVSLAISDLSIAVLSMTTEVFWDLPGGWILGNAGCKLLTYIQCILFASTAFIHMSISIDRYEAICTPVLFSQRYLRNRKMIGISWLMALIISVPQLFVFLQVENADSDRDTYLCRSNGYTAEWQRKLYVTWNAALFFLLPLICITFCYAKIAYAVWTYEKPLTEDSKSNYPSLFSNSTIDKNSLEKRTSSHQKNIPTGQRPTFSKAKLQTIQVTVCILFSYTFCWIPYFTVALLNVWSDYVFKNDIEASFIGTMAQCLCWFSSCLNPIIYGCFKFSDRCRRLKLPRQCPRALH